MPLIDPEPPKSASEICRFVEEGACILKQLLRGYGRGQYTTDITRTQPSLLSHRSATNAQPQLEENRRRHLPKAHGATMTNAFSPIH